MASANVWRRLETEWLAAVERLAGDAALDERSRAAKQMPFALSPPALFAQLEDVRMLWNELRTSPQVPKLANKFINTAWTLKDLLAHLASWGAEFRSEVETAARGGQFDYAIPFALSVVGPNQWNQVEVEKRRGLALTEIFQQFDAEVRRMQDLVFDLPPQTLMAEARFPLAPSGNPAEGWRGNCALILAMKCMHDRYHLLQIERWLAAQAQSERERRRRR